MEATCNSSMKQLSFACFYIRSPLQWLIWFVIHFTFCSGCESGPNSKFNCIQVGLWNVHMGILPCGPSCRKDRKRRATTRLYRFNSPKWQCCTFRLDLLLAFQCTNGGGGGMLSFCCRYTQFLLTVQLRSKESGKSCNYGPNMLVINGRYAWPYAKSLFIHAVVLMIIPNIYVCLLSPFIQNCAVQTSFPSTPPFFSKLVAWWQRSLCDIRNGIVVLCTQICIFLYLDG